MLRRRFLGGIVASGSVLFSAPRAVGAAAAAATGPTTQIRLGYIGNVCEAASYAAPDSGVFRRNGVSARLVRFGSESALITALGGGSIDAASMNLPALLRPLESKLDVRVVAGLHAGCLRVVSPDPLEVAWLRDLRGKKIATDRLGGPSMNLLSALMGSQGIDPRSDVSWHVYDTSGLTTALEAKSVECVAASDPLAYFLIASKLAQPYLDTSDGGFTCGQDFAHGHHCFLALHGGLVRDRPALASAITRSYVATSAAIPAHAGIEALRDARGGYADDDISQTIGMLSSYLWNPSTDLVAEEIELSARDFQAVGLLHPDTDPHELAIRAFADVLHA